MVMATVMQSGGTVLVPLAQGKVGFLAGAARYRRLSSCTFTKQIQLLFRQQRRHLPVIHRPQSLFGHPMASIAQPATTSPQKPSAGRLPMHWEFASQEHGTGPETTRLACRQMTPAGPRIGTPPQQINVARLHRPIMLHFATRRLIVE